MTSPAAARDRTGERRAVELMRAAVLAYYSPAWPPACACCGTAEDLGIEHVNGDGRQQREALFGLNTVSGRFYRWIIGHGFPADPPLQVHCRPCNTSKGTGPACQLDHSKDQVTRRREANTATQAAWRKRHGTQRHVSVKPGTAGGKVLAYLSEHGVTPAGELARVALGRPVEQAASTLSGLVRAGHIRRPAYGVYCLPGQEDQAAPRRRVYQPPPGGWPADQAAGRDWAAGTTWRTEAAGPGLCVGTRITIIGALREAGVTSGS